MPKFHVEWCLHWSFPGGFFGATTAASTHSKQWFVASPPEQSEPLPPIAFSSLVTLTIPPVILHRKLARNCLCQLTTLTLVPAKSKTFHSDLYLPHNLLFLVLGGKSHLFQVHIHQNP